MRQRLIELAVKKIRESRLAGRRPMATAEDVAHAGILAELDAMKRGLTLGPQRYRAMDEELERSASVAETPLGILRRSTEIVDEFRRREAAGEDMDLGDLHGRLEADRVMDTFRRRRMRESIPAPEVERQDVFENELLLRAINSLPSYRQREIIKLLYGFRDGREHTLEAVGRVFRITRERVRQIAIGALADLRKILKAETGVAREREVHVVEREAPEPRAPKQQKRETPPEHKTTPESEAARASRELHERMRDRVELWRSIGR
jgi:hypothetical protein